MATCKVVVGCSFLFTAFILVTIGEASVAMNKQMDMDVFKLIMSLFLNRFVVLNRFPISFCILQTYKLNGLLPNFLNRDSFYCEQYFCN